MGKKLRRKQVEKALMHVISHIDYDQHKQLLSDEETGENTYGEWVDEFINAYNAAARQRRA